MAQFMKWSAWGQEFDLALSCDRYVMGGGLAIELLEIEDGMPEPFSGLTVNLKEYPCEEGCAFVDVNNFPEAVELIEKYKLGEATGRMGISGWCAYPEYRFDMKEIEKYRLREEPGKEEKPGKDRAE